MPRRLKLSLPAMMALIVLAGLAAGCGGGGGTATATPARTVTAAAGATATPAALSGKLEIFSWWTTGGEAAGLKALYDLYQRPVRARSRS
jgi:ABC-type glycerol-3-phosphate transport system substrate-binding protein